MDASTSFDSYKNLSDDQLKALADTDNGYAQFLYAERLYQGSVRGPLDDRLGSGTATDIASEEPFKTMREYYIGAVRNHTRTAASRLATIYYGFNPAESRAWWRIEEKMGGVGSRPTRNSPNIRSRSRRTREGSPSRRI